MKKVRLIAATTCLAGMLFAGSALAADTAILTVQANVLGTCSFSAATALLDFGSIDPTSGVDATASTSIGYTCTNGVVYTLTTPLTGTMTGPGSIDFALAYTDSGSGTGDGLAQTLDIDGTIAALDYATAAAGVYTGTVNLAIDP